MAAPVAATGHQPVLLEETLAAMAIRVDGVYVDCTFGRGGHASEILRRMGEGGRLVAIDRDPQATAAAAAMRDPRLSFCRGAFDRLREFLDDLGLYGRVNGVLFDLGVSSPQLDQPERGFSFLREGPIDMRMDPTVGMPAAQWLESVSERELADCLHEYGEERHARRIARAIVAARSQRPLTTTTALAEVVARAHPAWPRGQHPATRTFQAIRIYVNDELNQLKRGLIQALEALAVGGRLLVISFHSLEDRIVKQFMRRESGHLGEPGPAVPAGRPRLRVLGKAVRPGEAEIRANARARSAVLRVAERLA
ncbi:MAG: 16S rRNA (cytosine(1402)-N(4))-methyltransferase RsmH [Gammaproteobacteria bacterium]